MIEGPIARILGSHQTTDVTINTHHSTVQPTAPDTTHRTETHTFVNSSREFAMLLEVKGRTLKLVSNDYIAAAIGDTVRAVCEPTLNGPLIVRDWHNLTRGIRFRTVPHPVTGAIKEFAVALFVLVIVGTILILFTAGGSGFLPSLITIGMVVLAIILAVAAVRKAAKLSLTHAQLDRLSG